MSDTAPTRRTSSLRALVMASALMLCVIVAAFVWLGMRALAAKDAVDGVSGVVAELPAAASAGDLDALDSLTGRLGTYAAAARDATTDPIWGIAEAMPIIGANFAAVRTVAVEADELTERAVTPLLALARQAKASGSDGGLLDLPLVSSARGPLRVAADALGDAQLRLADTSRTHLLGPVANGVSAFSDAVSAGAPTVAALADAADVLPGVLGAEGPRTILVMIQNNAELRTGGGITGSFVLLSADGGKVGLLDQADSTEFARRDASIIPLPEAMNTLYGDVVGRFVQNASIPSDFAVTGQLASAWWQQRTGVAPDAVLSIDPVVVSALLRVSGPIILADGSELSADTVTQRLLIDPYMSLDSTAQTVFLQSVTGALFTHLLSGPIDPIAWAEALTTPIADGRISVWSSRADEQAVLAETPLAGPAARHRAAGRDAFAVYFNDATGGKMDTFLDVDIAVGTAVCRADGRPEVLVRLTMGSHAPEGAGDILPMSMTGGGLFGTGSGDIGTSVSVAAPPGMYYGGTRKNGEPEVSADIEDAGFPTSLVRVNLSPGEVNTLDFRFIAAEPGSLDPRILHTPLLVDPAVDTSLVVLCE